MSHQHHHQHQAGAPSENRPDGALRAQLSKLWIARVDTAADSRAILGGVCYCCKTALATGPDGTIYAAWRHVYPGNIRDIAFTSSRDSGRTFAPAVRVSADNWTLDGCPDDGPSIAVDRQNRVHVVWPTVIDNGRTGGDAEAALFIASSSDGRRFTSRQRLPTENTPRHPQIVAGAGGDLIAAWDEGSEGVRRVVWARAVPSGDSVRFARAGVVEHERAVYPSLASTGAHVALAWTGGSGDASHISIQRIR
jgi:hypothetical protein